MLIGHIIVALFGIVISTLMYAMPSQLKYRLSMAALTLTLLSGTALVFSTNANLARTCLSGLLYVGFVSIMMYFGKRKLAKETVSN